MAKVKIQGNASGTGVLTVTAPNTSTDRTITLPDATGELLSTAGGTMTGDLILGDDVSLEIGSGTNGDLQLYHSGGHNTIDSKTGDLVIRTNALRMYNQANSEALIKGDADGEVQLFHNGVEKFNTTATGVAVTGGVAIGGTGTANTLDDYEEGTWTPTSSAFGSITVHSCIYTKIGRQVTLQAYIVGVTPNSNGITLGGLPFACPSNGWSVGSLNYAGHNTNHTNPHVRVKENTSDIQLKKDEDSTMIGTECYGHIIFTVAYFV
jgi:hypothetical protein